MKLLKSNPSRSMLLFLFWKLSTYILAMKGVILRFDENFIAHFFKMGVIKVMSKREERALMS